MIILRFVLKCVAMTYEKQDEVLIKQKLRDGVA